MIKAEEKTVACMSCGQMLVLSGYNTTICPACGMGYYDFECTPLEAARVFKEWCDRLRAAGKNPEYKRGTVMKLCLTLFED